MFLLKKGVLAACDVTDNGLLTTAAAEGSSAFVDDIINGVRSMPCRFCRVCACACVAAKGIDARA